MVAVVAVVGVPRWPRAGQGTDMEVLLGIMAVTWMLKQFVTESRYAAKGQMPPRTVERLARMEAAGSSGGTSSPRRQFGTEGRARYGFRDLLADNYHDGWEWARQTQVGRRHARREERANPQPVARREPGALTDAVSGVVGRAGEWWRQDGTATPVRGRPVVDRSATKPLETVQFAGPVIRCPDCGSPLVDLPPIDWRKEWGQEPSWSHPGRTAICSATGRPYAPKPKAEEPAAEKPASKRGPQVYAGKAAGSPDSGDSLAESVRKDPLKGVSRHIDRAKARQNPVCPHCGDIMTGDDGRGWLTCLRCIAELKAGQIEPGSLLVDKRRLSVELYGKCPDCGSTLGPFDPVTYSCPRHSAPDPQPAPAKGPESAAEVETEKSPTGDSSKGDKMGTEDIATEVATNEDARRAFTAIRSAAVQAEDAVDMLESAMKAMRAAAESASDGMSGKKFDSAATAAVDQLVAAIDLSLLARWSGLLAEVEESAGAGMEALAKYEDSEALVAAENIDASTLSAASS